jgi:hypothetical protein
MLIKTLQMSIRFIQMLIRLYKCVQMLITTNVNKDTTKTVQIVNKTLQMSIRLYKMSFYKDCTNVKV